MQRRGALTGPLRRPRSELRSGPERLSTLRGNAKAGASNARGLTFDETGRPPVAEVIGLPATASVSSYNRADHRLGGTGRPAPTPPAGVKRVRIIASTCWAAMTKLMRRGVPASSETVGLAARHLEVEGLTVQPAGGTRAGHAEDSAALLRTCELAS